MSAFNTILPGEEKKKKQNGVDPLVKDFSDLIRAEHEAAGKAALAGLEESYHNSMAELDAAQAALPGTYNAARNQAAGQSARAQRNFDVAAAASGLGAGTGAQARLARGVTLQNELGALDRAQADALAELGLQRTKADSAYNSAVAKEKAENDRSLADKLYKESIRVEEETARREQDARDFAFEQEKYANQKAQQDWENAFAREQFNTGVIQQNLENLFNREQYDDKQTQQDWENAFAREQYEDEKTQQEWENDFDEQVQKDKQETANRELELAERKYEDSRADAKAAEVNGTERAKNLVAGILSNGQASMADKVIAAYEKALDLTDAEVRYLKDYFRISGN